MYRKAVGLVIAILLAASASQAEEALKTEAEKASAVPELTAEQILAHMAEVYASCKTYRDSGEGTVTTHTVLRGKRRTSSEELAFSTVFVRPKLFRFEFRMPAQGSGVGWGHLIVHATLSGVQSWWDVEPGVKAAGPLEWELITHEAVTEGTSSPIAHLLLPDGKWYSRPLHKELTDVKLLPDAELDGVLCFRIDGHVSESPVKLWIDKSTFLLRRFDKVVVLGLLRGSETTVTYRPEIDVEISPEELKFNAPE